MEDDSFERDGVEWTEINRAAKLSRTKATIIAGHVSAGAIPSITIEGKTFIPVSAANRLKRETAFMQSIARNSRIGDTLSPGSRLGPLSRHREKQEVLPMPSGRKGRGWEG